MYSYCIDIENNIKIPQNKNEYFIFNYPKDWKSSIDLQMNINTPVNILNLFLIFKTFLNLNRFELVFFYTVSVDQTKTHTTKVFYSEKIRRISNLSLDEFDKWIKHRIAYDFKYINEFEFYNFRFVFRNDLENNINLYGLKPKYPWNFELIKISDPHKNYEEDVKDFINSYKILWEKEKKQLIKKIKILKLNNFKKFRTYKRW